MSRCISKPPLPSHVLYWIVSTACNAEQAMAFKDLTRPQAIKNLKTWAEVIADAHPEAKGLWYNVSKRKIYGKYLVVWGIGEHVKPPLP